MPYYAKKEDECRNKEGKSKRTRRGNTATTAVRVELRRVKCSEHTLGDMLHFVVMDNKKYLVRHRKDAENGF